MDVTKTIGKVRQIKFCDRLTVQRQVEKSVLRVSTFDFIRTFCMLCFIISTDEVKLPIDDIIRY